MTEGLVAVRSTEQETSGWRARLEMGFEPSEAKTVLRHCSHEGPLRVQRPFYPDADGTCHVYLLHPPGGVVGGDELEVSATAAAGTRVLVTTPGATKLYRSRGPWSRVQQRLRVGAGARLDWLPQETIAFSGTRAALHTVVELAASATFSGWEISCLGRPASGEDFAAGELTQRLEVWREHVPVFCERLHLRGGDAFLHQAWGMRGRTVVGTLVVATAERELLPRVRAARPDLFGAQLGSAVEACSGTALEGAAVFRFVGDSARRAQESLAAIWALARSPSGGSVSYPRIWST